MKKIFAVFLCAGMTTIFSGCSLGNILEEFTSTGDSTTEASAPDTASEEVKERVYMDEISGSLKDFTGNTLTLSAHTATYVFDVSQAALECEDGMITGDQVSVIYEGQLENTDTSMVKALKVVDEFHKKNKLKVRTAYGIIQKLTPNTITIKSDRGNTATYPITGTEQYYKNGIKKGNWVYIRFKGTYPDGKNNSSDVLNASHLKVLNISDLKDFKGSKSVSLPPYDASQKETSKHFQATIQSIDGNILHVIPERTNTIQTLDLTNTPTYFKGGTAPGSRVTVTYTGERKDDTLADITVLSVSGEDPAKLNKKHISFTASGSVIGTTFNTVTIKTTDGAIDTFRIDEASDLSTSGLSEGSSVCITFDPSKSEDSNIYEALKITDG